MVAPAGAKKAKKGKSNMTKPTAGGTKHNWLVEDLAAVVSDLRHTADGILRDLDNYQESREEVYLSSLATRIARLFQEIARITAVQAQMRALIDAAKSGKSHGQPRCWRL